MLDFSTHYGVQRPAQIAARIEATRARCFPSLAPQSAAPTVAPVARIPRAQIAAWQAEREQLRADLPTLRFYAIDAEFSGFGPSFEEVREAENRLAVLDDYLIFEPDFAAPPLALAPLLLAA